MHEKTQMFVDRLKAAGIYDGVKDVCLDCHRVEYVWSPFGQHRFMRPITGEQAILLVAALVEAGITLDEIRKRMVSAWHPNTILTDAEILLGRWELAGCIQTSTLIKWVEERATVSTVEGQ